MVAINEIKVANAKLTASTVPRVSVFVGGTSGIGKATIKRLASTGFPVKIYVVGRKSTRPAMEPFLDELRTANPKADLVWAEGEIALLSEVKRICRDIEAAESSVDLLFLSAGYAPLGGTRNDTPEGLETTHALQYYGRILFTLHLLPLLRASSNPRVMSILAGCFLSGSIDNDDINLDKPGAFGGFASQARIGTLNTVGFDQLAADKDNAGITFIHSWPGAVNTGNMARYWKPSTFSFFPWTELMKPLFFFMGVSHEDSAEKHLYQATTGTFGGDGPKVDGVKAANTAGSQGRGLYLLDDKCEVSYNAKTLDNLRAKSQAAVWAKTTEILKPYL
ncbi:hypothetical protein F5X68DRAFT_260167 [Plectosphaerella plurivora]|uniref:Uncharacterized protein n=1 Tax=Plectosphaerella plurivora TaxID=936078 RepID=A0A9P8VD80_9PEZI|nr:hypothetical protein F5X68DRAFT_260167 [Plectosphaerella plurivora]